ncbi:mechanosensitive ion channel protein [Massilia cavernae]|uniref:Mechanosensitive ion channel protein n=1 Tax=Massilia cavernae TaxID=2320864 RepID=A0A418XPY2_9BURK|nr:mechanosensitive ion channel protein [Massilia cavernae]
MLWQVAAIVVCVALGWFMARAIRSRRAEGVEGHAALVRAGFVSFAQILTPLLIAALVWGVKLVLVNFLHNVSLLKVALPIFASLAVIRTAFYLLQRVFARRGQLGAALVTFEKIFALLVWAGVALYLAGLWPDIIAFLNGTKLPLGRSDISLAMAIQAVVSVVVLLMLALWAGTALEERLMGMEGMHTSLRVAMARIGRAILIVVAVLFSLQQVGIDLTVLSVFGGALGVGLGLGLQKIASNYVSGFVILLERSLAIGDNITVDKYSGKVARINTRYTVLRSVDGTESVVPNEMLVSGAVINSSFTDRKTRLVTEVIVGFDTDLASLLPQIVETCRGVKRVMQEPAPEAFLLRFTPDGLLLEVGMWIQDPDKSKGEVLSEANLKIWSLLQAEGVTLPRATRELRLADPRFDVLLDKAATLDSK